MPILSIDTAGETAIVALGNDHEVIASETNADQKNHASFVQPALQRIMKKTALSFKDIEAVSVVNGPGSYTGLRVGLASAKGIAYAASAPLILLNTLEVMALAAVKEMDDQDVLYCPMIDARRNEVFTAIYTFGLKPLLPPQPVVLDSNSFAFFFEKSKIVFFGSGHHKSSGIIRHPNAVFTPISYSVNHINKLSHKAYSENEFTDLAYAEPFYTKEFFSTGQ